MFLFLSESAMLRPARQLAFHDWLWIDKLPYKTKPSQSNMEVWKRSELSRLWWEYRGYWWINWNFQAGQDWIDRTLHSLTGCHLKCFYYSSGIPTPPRMIWDYRTCFRTPVLVSRSMITLERDWLGREVRLKWFRMEELVMMAGLHLTGSSLGGDGRDSWHDNGVLFTRQRFVPALQSGA